jgi:hypothetical protein
MLAVGAHLTFEILLWLPAVSNKPHEVTDLARRLDTTEVDQVIEVVRRVGIHDSAVIHGVATTGWERGAGIDCGHLDLSVDLGEPHICLTAGEANWAGCQGHRWGGVAQP